MQQARHAKRALALFTICFTAACGSSDNAAGTAGSDAPTKATITHDGGAPAPSAPSGAAESTPPANGDAPSPPSSSPPSSSPPSNGTDPPASPPAAGADPPAATPPAPPATPPAAPPTPAPPQRLRGTNLVGMEGGYGFDQASGPAPDRDYAVHSTQVIDYLAAKRVNVLRFLFSWERMQPTLGGPIPAASSGNYKAYFDDYKRIVDYATNEKGMTVIVEPWQSGSGGAAGGARWRGNLVGGSVVTSAHFADFWTKMATVYASNPRVAIGLVNEPNNMSTMAWFAIAQDAITAIRGAGFRGDIHVPGNGWTGAGSWNDSSYDTASPKRSNAYGWLNARGPGLPLFDPLGKLVVGVHSYADPDASGGSTTVMSSTVTRSRLTGVIEWARAHALPVFVGEIGMYAGAPNAKENWSDFVGYLDANADTLVGFAWWACGKPGWWNDVAASGGGHFSITPTGGSAGDTINMGMIQGAFGP
jgi:endoglucanase